MLTHCEKEVALLIAEGLAVKQIAARLFRSQYTIDNHRKAIYRKLDIHDRMELAFMVRDGRVKL